MPEKPSKLMPALYGGIIIGAISAVPFLNFINCCCCAGVLLGGFLSVFFYKNELQPGQPPIESGDALALGALAGLFGAIIGTLVHAVFLASIGDISSGALFDAIKNFGGANMPPEALDQIEEQLSKSKEFSGFAIFFTFITSIILDPLFGLLGGLIGYSVFKSKQPPVATMPPMPPMQPPPVTPTV